ncbi:hypothetical protein RND71_022560 [Anisodus tanguticus]|uniref:RRM domain-containing protein n=1 Tax=Anisodus tanguticus TaxID=243964 RepID=A0AAE1VDW2_9SOLA|nr:hypothetical protein RND71_022560 [Anisodus tanguticus]
MAAYEIEEEFKKFGKLKPDAVAIRTRKDIDVCHAFVEFEDVTGVQNAIEASTVQIGGHQLYIEGRRPNRNNIIRGTFVTMSSLEDCKKVIENLDGREYGGRTLRVNFSDKPKPKEPLYPETEHKLFVGNLAWSVTSDRLVQAFQQFGTVVGETGRSHGYGL